MAKTTQMEPDAAREHLIKGKRTAIRVDGVLNLREAPIKKIYAPVSCYELDATGSQLVTLPETMKVESQVILDNCSQLESLPKGLKCGSLSLRNCQFLSALPEGLSTWFLDLTDCRSFRDWPKRANVQRGIVRLRNCIQVQTLPRWMSNLGQLDLAGCIQLTQVRKGLQVSSWIDIGGSGVAGLPESLDGTQLRWRGVPVSHRIAFEPQSITSDEILRESNAELRRVMIERMGYLEFAEQAGAKRLDSDQDPGGKRELLKIQLEDDEPLVGLSCFCPSTGRQYFLRVPPKTKTCHQAAAWMAGFDNPKLYKPVLET